MASEIENDNQHGPGGGYHVCLFCGGVYPCLLVHTVVDYGNDGIRPGARCCPDCRRANLINIERWEMERREKLYAE